MHRSSVGIKGGEHLLNNNDCRPPPADLRLPPKSRVSVYFTDQRLSAVPSSLLLLLLMHPGRSADDWLPAALSLLLLSCSFSRAHSSTLEHDFPLVHNVDNRSPEIDPFWYVGRGVRPIGRFGKRHSGLQGSGGATPGLRTLSLLLHSLRNKESLEEEDRDWLP
ncbi:hypothetical protein NQZ68_035103 [Dissostichus eleginoides]|nr:hypothetical protein NQZ68_035103 [Dissostichus eleginoides]